MAGAGDRPVWDDRYATRGLVFFSDINGLRCNMERVAHVGVHRRSLFDHSTRRKVAV